MALVVMRFTGTHVSNAKVDSPFKLLADDLNMERGIVSGRVAFVATIC